MRTRLLAASIVLAALVAPAWTAEPEAKIAAGDAMRFKSPDEALTALLEAFKARDMTRVRAIFGVEPGELGSGDQVQDRADLESFAKSLAVQAKFVPKSETELVLEVGNNGFEFPVPLVRKDNEWYFDTPAGKEEILNRRIGENELRTLAVCRGYVAAQRDYYSADWDGDGVIEYAQQLASTPGKKDGLYWESRDNEPASPLGPLVAEAQAEGYDMGATPPATTQPTTKPAPGPRTYHGYHYKILTKQGENAPGGKFDYVINGHMVAGFALVAWPADWGNSGVMTFVVNSNGKVYQKNLGKTTADIVKNMTEYNPDKDWALTDD
jgi:hypothetical protein